MRPLYLGSCILSISAVAMLSGCGGSSGAGSVVPSQNIVRNTASQTKTFYYTGAEQSFKVPPGVTSLHVIALGAAGASAAVSGGEPSGYGGRVYAVIPVRPGETLGVFVGGKASGINGGFNGGGNGGPPCGLPTFGGGGASDVREGGDGLHQRVLVAGGGGGEGSDTYYGEAVGGGGGRRTGGTGGSYNDGGAGGLGGTQVKGGAGGGGAHAGKRGALGDGGRGGKCGFDTPYNGYPGGGGGGGYYGGGGGGGGWIILPGGGGGGGSSFVESKASKVHMWRGWKNANGDGLVVFGW